MGVVGGVGVHDKEMLHICSLDFLYPGPSITRQLSLNSWLVHDPVETELGAGVPLGHYSILDQRRQWTYLRYDHLSDLWP